MIKNWETRLQKARTALILDHPFFGTLLLRLRPIAKTSIKTMATDGVSLFCNPNFVEKLSAAELKGILAHEVMHPALQHHTRRDGRDLGRWNRACDYAINPMLIEAGLTLPSGVLSDPRFNGMSAEEIYNHLKPDDDGGSDNTSQDGPSTESANGDSAHGKGIPDESSSGPTAPETPGGFGQVLDAPVDQESPSVVEQARDWQIAVDQAESISRLAGKLPAGAKRSLEAAHDASVDWRELLRRAWSDTIPADYCWIRPNRRHIWDGLYLPGIVCEGVGEVAIAIDCSGSINARQLGLFEAEIQSILAGQRPQRVHILYFDTIVHRVDSYESGQPIHLSPQGGGGTEFGPCFEWLNDHGIVPQALVFLTDLCGSFPDREPNFPVIWATTKMQPVPFGEAVPMGAA